MDQGTSALELDRIPHRLQCVRVEDRQQPLSLRAVLGRRHRHATSGATDGDIPCPHAANVTATSGEMSADDERRFHAHASPRSRVAALRNATSTRGSPR